jgi:SAM-dependent methyltransferase
MNEIIEQLRADYDAVAYNDEPHPLSHPNRLAVVAAMRGISPRPIGDCRVLEIGCATGGNLIPMAEQLPGSRLLGFDLSPRQIEAGCSIISALGLSNVELRCQDIMDFPNDGSTFDYIIAHGVYTWVPDAVRQQVLRLCRRHLAPNGVAFISYNTYPGWRSRLIMRDLMLYHSRGTSDPIQRVARGREIMRIVSESTPETNYFRDMMRDFHTGLIPFSDSYVLHEHLTSVNSPQYFWQFIDEARANGLAYLGDADHLSDQRTMLSAAVREKVAALTGDEIEREQYVDFLVNRIFRRSVVCRAETAGEAKKPASSPVRSMHIAGRPAETPAGTGANGQPIIQFGAGHHTIKLWDPAPIAVMRHLGRTWPATTPFSELASVALGQLPKGADPQQVAERLVEAIDFWHAHGLVELWVDPPAVIASGAGQHPCTMRFARWQAVHRPFVTTLRQIRINPDEKLRALLQLLDGTRDRQALIDGDSASHWGMGDSQKAGLWIETALRWLVGESLLVNGT